MFNERLVLFGIVRETLGMRYLRCCDKFFRLLSKMFGILDLCSSGFEIVKHVERQKADGVSHMFVLNISRVFLLLQPSVANAIALLPSYRRLNSTIASRLLYRLKDLTVKTLLN